MTERGGGPTIPVSLGGYEIPPGKSGVWGSSLRQNIEKYGSLNGFLGFFSSSMFFIHEQRIRLGVCRED